MTNSKCEPSLVPVIDECGKLENRLTLLTRNGRTTQTRKCWKLSLHSSALLSLPTLLKHTVWRARIFLLSLTPHFKLSNGTRCPSRLSNRKSGNEPRSQIGVYSSELHSRLVISKNSPDLNSLYLKRRAAHGVVGGGGRKWHATFHSLHIHSGRD